MPARDENHFDSSAGSASKSRFNVASGVSPAVASNLSRTSGGSFFKMRRSFTASCWRMVSRCAS